MIKIFWLYICLLDLESW